MVWSVLGDLIVGLEEVNADWWRGHLNGDVGIFPLTHVSQIQLKPKHADASLTSGKKFI